MRMLDCAKKIGLTMTDSYMMSPTKSVTAIIGISTEKERCPISGCEACGKRTVHTAGKATKVKGYEGSRKAKPGTDTKKRQEG